MRELAKSILPRPVTGSGYYAVIAPPTVETALSLFAVLPGWAAGDEGDRLQVRRLLYSWLPMRLASLLSGSAVDPTSAVEDVLALVNRELPMMGDSREAVSLADLVTIRWDLLVADVSQSWRMDFEAVLALPWPRFLLLLANSRAADARYTLRRMPLHILPHAADSEGLLADLRAAAELPEDEAAAKAEADEGSEEVQIGRLIAEMNFAADDAAREAAFDRYRDIMLARAARRRKATAGSPKGNA